MDPQNNAPPPEPKPKNRLTCAENEKNRDDKFHASTSRSSSAEPRRDPRKIEHYKKPERSLERESLSGNRDRSIMNRQREAAREEEPRDMMKEMPHSYQVYGYPGYPMGDPSYMNSGRNSVIPLYQGWSMPNVNAQWAINPMDSMNVNPALCVNASATLGMSPSMDINGSAAAVSVSPYSYIGPLGNNANMCGMMSYAQYGMYSGDCSPMVHPAQEVHLTRCVLYPPSSLVPLPKREKPNGCKTVYIGGIPSNTTEDMIREVFQRFGEIDAVRMNSKNFCHVKFVNETSVDAAVSFSGYRMKIDGKDDDPNTGRIHVDYAESYDNQNVYENDQQRVPSHLEPESHLLIPHYSEHEATDVADKLKKRDTFREGLTILTAWVERGECCKKNSSTFFSMIQSTYCHVRQLSTDKVAHEKEINKTKAILSQKSHSISLHFKEIAKVLNAARMQKVWDHFTRTQRKKFEDLKRDIEEQEKVHVQEVVKERNEVDMEVDSDGEDQGSNEKRVNQAAPQPQNELKSKFLSDIENLRNENATLQCLLEASQNEVEVARSDTEQQKKFHDVQFQKVQQALKNAEKEFSTLSQRRAREDTFHADQNSLKRKRDEEIREAKDDQEIFVVGTPEVRKPSTSVASTSCGSVEMNARFIGLISAFLNVHPFGASIDYICSYLHQIDSTILSRDIESLMKQFPNLFKEESTGIGASLEKKWFFCGFKPRA